MGIAHWSNFEFRLLMSSSVMMKDTRRECTNISISALELFKSLCEECPQKRKRSTSKGMVIRPIPRKEFASRGQADLVDM